ncbi:Crp/Fnr family transcriptional regulator [Thermodesulfobacteriota bacterium]
MKKYSEFLSHMRLFNGLDSEVLADISVRLRELRAKKGAVLFRKEMEGTVLYIIHEGAVKIVLRSKLGDEIILNIFSKGDMFGEMSLLDGRPRSSDAIAVKPSKLLLLNRNDFMNLLRQHDSVKETLIGALAVRLRKTEGLMEDTSFLNIPARFAKKLIDLGETFGRRRGNALEINLRLTQNDLANIVGATRETINKELRILREKGLVSTMDKVIRIHNVERLKNQVSLNKFV